MAKKKRKVHSAAGKNLQKNRTEPPSSKEGETFYVNLKGPLLYEWKLWLSKNETSAATQLTHLVKKFINEIRKQDVSDKF